MAKLNGDVLEIEGRKYITMECLSFGDYGGAGSVGKANINYIRENYKGKIASCYWGYLTNEYMTEHEDLLLEIREGDVWFIYAYGSYSSETIFILEEPAIEELQDLISGLANYPCIEDEGVSEVEIEWENEAWSSYLEHDLAREFEVYSMNNFEHDYYLTMFEYLEDGEKWEEYRAAMEEENCYPEPEYNGVYIDIKRISATYCDFIIQAIHDRLEGLSDILEGRA